MKNIKHLPIFLALGLASCLTVAAQTPDPQNSAPQATQAARPAPDPARQANHLAKRLNLTPDQVNQIEPILANQIQQMQAIRSDSSLSKQDRIAKVKALHEDSVAKIKSVLNAGQQQKYDELLQKQHDRMMQRRQERQQSSPSA